MSNDLIEIPQAIYEVLSENEDELPIFYLLAPQGQALPYVIIQRQAGADEYVFGGEGGVSTTYVVKVISNRSWPSEAQELYGRIHNLLQNAALDIEGFLTLRCERSSTIEYSDPQRFWHVGGIYRIEVWSEA